MNHETLFKINLKHHGYKITPSRLLVFQEVLKTDGITESLLADKLSGEVDRSTVYRTVALFESLGLIVRLWNGWKSSVEVSSSFVSHHHHITCRICGVIKRLESDELERAVEKSVSATGFSNISHILEFTGVCGECGDKSK